MVKWKKSSLLTKLVSSKGGFAKLHKGKTAKAKKRRLTPFQLEIERQERLMVKKRAREAFEQRLRNYKPKETGIYKL